jgi:RNA polymerase sigma-70 factor, ECF subfamily
MVATYTPAISNRSVANASVSARASAESHVETLAQFNELVLKYQDAVYQQACWILGEETAAEDATQEAFLRAYRNFHLYNGSSFRAWIMRIAVNYCYDQIRRRKVRKTTPLDIYDENDESVENQAWLRDPGASVEETLIRAEEQRRVLKCINNLPPDYRAAITLVDLQDLNYTEAAEVCNVPVGTFKSRLSRARVLLQKLLVSEREPNH